MFTYFLKNVDGIRCWAGLRELLLKLEKWPIGLYAEVADWNKKKNTERKWKPRASQLF